MSADSSDLKSKVLSTVDIVELVGQTVALKRRGKNYIGLCPFHQEKTPSFNVDPARQYFKCWGCKEGGNCIDFVMKRDRIEFIDAMKLLATQAGIEITKFGGSKEKTGEKQLLLDAHSAAASYFEKNLTHPDLGLPAREYLAKRGFNAESIARFHIGIAPNSWDGLLRSPFLKKFPPPLLTLAGLAKARENGTGHYDTFRNRLMFPIRDENGRVIAFGGRVMPGSEDPAKYLNSPETLLFSKSRSIFGIDVARQRIVETRTAVVVEGYTDVIMAHQYGVSNVVSILGTAMTEQHVNILRRFADRVVLLFDADTAGDTAVDKTVSLFLTQPIEIAIASMPEGVDPDEFLINSGAEAFEKLVADAQDALTYKWKQLSRRFVSRSGDITAQQKAAEEYLQTLATARGTGPVDPMRWGAALARVSRLTEIPVDELNRRFKNSTSVRGPVARVTPRATEPASVGDEAPVPPQPIVSARDRAEKWILGCLLVQPERWTKVQQTLAPEQFNHPVCRKLADVYWEYQRDEGEPVFQELLGLLKDPAVADLAIAAVEEIDALNDADLTLSEAIAHLAQVDVRREKIKLVADLRRTAEEPVSDEDQVLLLKKLTEQARRPDLRRAQ